MTLAGPQYNFVKSRYFEKLKPHDRLPIPSYRLREGASDEDKRELEECANDIPLRIKLAPALKQLGLKDPYWTWDGRLVERSSLPADYPYNKGWKGIRQKYMAEHRKRMQKETQKRS